LKPIHIAGTKGKGSTSAFISSILSQYIPTCSNLRKIGLYTSPHLKSVRERIQINNEPLSEAVFAKYFFEIWDRLEEAARKRNAASDEPTKPVYFRYLTLMALHAYLREGVDVAIMECGIGGEYDSTNILVSPSVTAITNLGIDHTAMLGNTIDEIAWHKSGIFKPGATAFTVPQAEPAIRVLKQRATERELDLTVVERHPDLDHLRLGLAADFQKTNASLAISVAAASLRSIGVDDVPDPRTITNSKLPPKFKQGLEQVSWPGRCETRRDPLSKIVWHIDGAHTLESIEVAGRWFAEQVRVPTSQARASQKRKRILLFNQQTRDANALAKALHTTLAAALGNEKPFTHVAFSTNVTFADAGYKADLVSVNTNADEVQKLVVQRKLAETWADIDPSIEAKVFASIEEAVCWCRAIAKEEEEEVMVFVTGSLHLVGGALEVLDSVEP